MARVSRRLAPRAVLRAPRAAALTVASLALLASAPACRRGDAAAAGGGPYADKVADAIPRIEKATGLKYKRPPKVEVRSHDEVRSFLEKEFTDSRATKDLAAKAAVYKRLGLLPDSLDVRKLYVDLLTEQIVGFYDPKTKVLYVVNGAPKEAAGMIITHELIHALQDQYFDLDSLQNVEGDDDRVSAAQAVAEGQATFEQLSIAAGTTDFASHIPGGWDRMRQIIRENQSSMPVFASAPMLIQESLIFPYLSGAEFMRRFEARRPGQAPFGDMPQSTEQILHEPAYFGARRDVPLRVTLPPLDGSARATYENDFGEFETRLFLFQHLRDQNAAIRGAAGWGGDRFALVSMPKGEGVVWLSAWDTPVDAGEFDDLLGQAVERRYGVKAGGAAAADAGGESTRRYDVAGRSVTITAGEVQGHPVVLYVDVPAGAGVGTGVVDLAKARVE